VTVFARQATATSLVFILASELIGLAILNDPTYVSERWHTTLLMWVVALIAFIQNI
jgi:choline transport protein